MINKKQLTEMAKHILKHPQGLRDYKIMHPEREWFLGLGIGLSIFILCAVGSGYTYWKNKNMSSVQNFNLAEEAVVYRESMVKEALTRFQDRNREREVLMAEFSVEAPSEVELEVATTTPSGAATSTQEADQRVASSTEA